MVRTLVMNEVVKHRSASRGHARGFAYIALLILIACMGVALAAVGDVWHTEVKRQKEEELLFIGDQMRNALAAYATGGQGYPTTLDDLVQDPRTPSTRRYLRKIYPDPVTGDTKWGLLKGASGEILGVHSLSDEEPIKQSNFNLADRMFEGKKKYSEWVFMIPAANIPARTDASPNPPRFAPRPPAPRLQTVIP